MKLHAIGLQFYWKETWLIINFLETYVYGYF